MHARAIRDKPLKEKAIAVRLLARPVIARLAGESFSAFRRLFAPNFGRIVAEEYLKLYNRIGLIGMEFA
jgi:hypothetical protein